MCGSFKTNRATAAGLLTLDAFSVYEYVHPTGITNNIKCGSFKTKRAAAAGLLALDVHPTGSTNNIKHLPQYSQEQFFYRMFGKAFPSIVQRSPHVIVVAFQCRPRPR
jgi:hypothetical protein